MRILALALLLAAACGGKGPGGPAQPPAEPSSLYQRLGGIETIRVLVDRVMLEAAADERIGDFFVRADIGALKRQLAAKLCEITGGPCRYRGRSMSEAHAGLEISEAHFRAWMEDLSRVLEDLEIGRRERMGVLRALAAMKDDIVTR